ncbi:DEAD/DEAH box helicase [Selenihalanaerobacter shriftii]|uniref:Competence protein ComFA n=1 Tax=Selenihalanaerobacter shriftii TaxID=142842 RepID=A0A1T4KPQ7_9FIRM|nr:DEAD/DEAH box helicase family protein [Selenihalanaerobacter shriftii]SJZ44392.1 competence protein ComFA [Selenihalanaerobacter shriftii]
MKEAKFVIYLLVINQKRYKVNLAYKPEIELSYYLQNNIWANKELKAYALTKPLPIGLVEYTYKRVTTVQEREGVLIRDLFDDITELKHECSRRIEDVLSYYSLTEYNQIRDVKSVNITFPSKKSLKGIHQLLAGRLLYYDEIIDALGENQLTLNTSLSLILQTLKLETKLEIIPSIFFQADNHLVCQRCGEEEKLIAMECNYCGLTDYYCDNCISMGQARICRPLYEFKPVSKTNTVNAIVKPKLNFELTAAQSDASQELVQFLSSQQQEALVWAVCGAGKTEVSFQAIAKVLARGGEVLFAIPRKDAVIELAPRLKESFPNFEVSVLYGGSETKYDLAPITVATTHQVLRFKDKFDLIILDEVDAFPYQGNQMLKRAVNRSCHLQGKIIYMTATPNNNLIDFEHEDDKILIKIPARYHGHPVPEPELVVTKLWYNKEAKEIKLSEKIFTIISQSIYQDLSQLFIFLPTRELVELVGEKLQEELPKINGESWVQYSHAQDSKRDKKREEFCNGKYPILVATTIMERAITVPKANVLVLFADWDFIFDLPTLIQMAGRAGRSLEYPDGEVWFIGQQITSEMKKAKSRIQSLNQEARKKGYLIRDN